ncbi:MAG: hypothetical protein WA133_13145 [Syntrophales bacterium]
MAEYFLSPKMFFRDLLVNFISGLAGGAVVGIFSGNFWTGFLSSVIILIVISYFWLWNKYGRMLKFIRSGSAGYYYSFSLGENSKVWQEAKRSFCYLGISADSILELFRRWIEKNPLSNYRILLMKPGSNSLKKQEAFQKGYDLNIKLEDLSPEARKTIEEAADATSNRIGGAISVLKNTIAFKEGRIEIKLYDEFSPWWTYLIDDRKIYVGILEKGKRGSDSPVMIVEKNEMYTSPFDAFKNHWERLWQSAVDA